MDLQNFVAETLTQIVTGVSQAQKLIAEGGTGAKINPTRHFQSSESKSTEASAVEFDVALTVASESGSASAHKTGGKIGVLSVFSASVSAEAEGKQTDQQRSEAVSRVKFQVMLAQPGDVIITPDIRVTPTGSYV